MEATKQFIRRNFKRYKELKKDEFSIKPNVRADAPLVKQGYSKSKFVTKKIKYEGYEDGVYITVVDSEFAEKLSPNNIDSSYFWKKATEVFPLASIAYSPGANNEIELNASSLQSNHIGTGSINRLINAFEKKEHPNILEIGPGYGCITGFIAENYSLKNYYAIDVNPLFKFKRLYQTDGKTIPECVPDSLDVVYSVNVFQHLSPEQRFSYYQQIKERLVVGGKFIFSMFVVDKETENGVILREKNGEKEWGRIFGIVDKKGNRYANFFSQLTKCNRIEELELIFKELNMDFEIFHKSINAYYMIATKK